MSTELVLNQFIEVQAGYRERHTGGEQWIFRFANGFGASVVRGPHTYGGPSGLFEVAVTIPDGPEMDDFEITYDTPVTGDVLGYLSVEDVRRHLLEIAELPAQVSAADSPKAVQA